MLKNPAEYEIGTSSAKFTDISHQGFPALLQGGCAGYCQRALVDESGMIRTQMGNAQWISNGRSSGIPAGNSNSNSSLCGNTGHKSLTSMVFAAQFTFFFLPTSYVKCQNMVFLI
jgi:hypothetical protein